MPLVNHAFARVPPAIFVIFVVFSRGLSSKALVLLVRMQIRHFRRFRQKNKKPVFRGTKARFTKGTVFGTLIFRIEIFQGRDLCWNPSCSKIGNWKSKLKCSQHPSPNMETLWPTLHRKFGQKLSHHIVMPEILQRE